uniref:peroxidase n=1 Tax=Salix viminalis TaxID=40686 RepID=A0A6N2NA07_SALVM
MPPLLAALLLLVSMGLISASTSRMRLRRNMIREPRSAASVMRFQFHDCLVNGCDASVQLLDDTPNRLGEKLAI